MPAKHSRKIPPCAPKKSRRRGNPATSAPDYTAEELEFMQAMDRYKREKSRPFPTWSEVLMVLRGLGWNKEKKGDESNRRKEVD
jgi:hypothetical protein